MTSIMVNPPENKRSYSSIYNNSAIGSIYAQSMVDSLESWTAGVKDTNQYMIIDLDKPIVVTGVATQGRYTPKFKVDSELVSTYSVQYSNDNQNWTEVTTSFKKNS